LFKQSNPPLRRILWLALSALLVTALALILFLPGSASTRPLPQPGSGKEAAQRVILTVAPTHIGKTFALGAVGLSIEAEELYTQDLSTRHRSLVALMRLLGPGVLRVGGNSLDYSWWTSNHAQRPEWATSVITPDDLVRLRELLAATDWRVILGVDLGHFNPASAANEALVAESILGSRLLGFEIGNEPNNYGDPVVKLRPSSYSASNYLQELATYSAAMQTAVPMIRLYGPDLGTRSLQEWLSVITSDKSAPFVAITQHYYPTFYNVSKGACKGSPPPTALELLSPQVRERESTALQAISRVGELAHRETRISETNTTASCDIGGGPATSPVFASALWSLDWVLRSASAGVAGLNFHGFIGRCIPNTFSPICASNYTTKAQRQVVAHPEYYGLLAARQLEDGRFVPVQISGESTSDNLTAYATVNSHGAITLAIDNLTTHGLTSVLLKVSGYDRAIYERLAAPSISATSGVTFGNASINVAGTIRPTGTKVPKIDGAFRLKLAPTSAAVITLHR
jgi:hypothetical protein